jgi:hypothetical protein
VVQTPAELVNSDKDEMQSKFIMIAINRDAAGLGLIMIEPELELDGFNTRLLFTNPSLLLPLFPPFAPSIPESLSQSSSTPTKQPLIIFASSTTPTQKLH